jgi:tRNA threonylcarbamoyladenosine biosynthesis protein TsaE
MRLLTTSVDDTRDLSEAIGRALVRPGDLVVLAGDLGSGKTAFAQGMARALGVTDPVVSPTFTIVREYAGTMARLVHVDVYRLDHLQELYDLGFEELVDSDRVTIVEWGDVVASVLPADRLVVHLDLNDDDDARVISLTTHGPSWHARQRALAIAVQPWLAPDVAGSDTEGGVE